VTNRRSATYDKAMRVVSCLLVAAVLTVGSTPAAAHRQPVLADALHAMHARAGSAYLADHGKRVVIVAAAQEAQWKGYVAASVYAAHGNPIHSVRLVRPKPLGDVTLRFPAVNCSCVYPGMNRLSRVRPTSRRQVLRAIEAAAQREGVRIDRIELLHPLAYAPVITVTARHPRRFLRLAKAPMLVDRLYRRIEGAYIFVRGPGGRPVASGGYTARSYTAFGEVGWAIPV
jgi:hypothetical protein